MVPQKKSGSDILRPPPGVSRLTRWRWLSAKTSIFSRPWLVSRRSSLARGKRDRASWSLCSSLPSFFLVLKPGADEVNVFLFIRPAQVKTARASGGNLLTKGRRGMILQEGALANLGSALMAVVTISGRDRRI